MKNPQRFTAQGGSSVDLVDGLDSRTVSKTAAPAQASPSQLLAIFRERCDARALMVAEGMLDLLDAVDQLQQAAVDQELVNHFGQDEIQQVMSDAFKRGGRRWIW